MLLCSLPACLQDWDELRLSCTFRGRLWMLRRGNAMREEELDEHYR